jgi:two-component system, NarL family, response regulator NreC
MNMARVVIIDDHPFLRTGLRHVLEEYPEFHVVGEAADGREGVQLVEREKPDVAIMDIGMPNLNGIEAARQIHDSCPEVSIIMLSVHSDESYVLRSLKAGARAYLLKQSAEAELIGAVKAAIQGKSFFSPAVSQMLLEDYMRQLRDREEEDTYELLTAREREILQMIAEGKSNKDIANLLHLSPYTVETHRANMMEKLNLHNVPELILYAVRKGIIS